MYFVINIQSLDLSIQQYYLHATYRLGVLLLLISEIACSTGPLADRSHLVFRYNEDGNITSLDPAFSRNLENIWATTHLFNGLVQLNDNLEVIPDVAEQWNVSADGLVYEFKIREDVYFHKHPGFGKKKTRRVTASDFVYSLKRLLDPQLASPGSWVLQNVKNIEAKNDRQLSITLKKAFPAFLGLLSMRYCSVIPHEIANLKEVDFRKNPIGTGPFAFKNWEENVKLVLRKNPLYFERDEKGEALPYLEAVAITFVPDKQSEFMLFLQGKLDLLNSLDNSYKDELLTQEGQLSVKYRKKISLQKEVRSNDAKVLMRMPHIKHFGAELKDFSDTAALIEHLDAVVSVDTSVAHLAGALGKPVHLLLSHEIDFRWLTDRPDSPWYPSMTIYRRKLTADWSDVMQQVTAELRVLQKEQ
mgnify:CR=1 FL=1